MKRSALKSAPLSVLAVWGVAASFIFGTSGTAQGQAGSRVCAFYGTDEATNIMYVGAVEYDKTYHNLCNDASEGRRYVDDKVGVEAVYKWPHGDSESEGTCEEFGLFLKKQYGEDPCLEMTRLNVWDVTVSPAYFEVKPS